MHTLASSQEVYRSMQLLGNLYCFSFTWLLEQSTTLPAVAPGDSNMSSTWLLGSLLLYQTPWESNMYSTYLLGSLTLYQAHWETIM